MNALDKFATGNNTLSLLFGGVFVGAIAAILFIRYWPGDVTYLSAAPAIRYVALIAGAAWALFALFMPNKGGSWRSPFGWAEMNGVWDWVVVAATIVGTFVLLVFLAPRLW